MLFAVDDGKMSSIESAVLNNYTLKLAFLFSFGAEQQRPQLASGRRLSLARVLATALAFIHGVIMFGVGTIERVRVNVVLYGRVYLVKYSGSNAAEYTLHFYIIFQPG